MTNLVSECTHYVTNLVQSELLGMSPMIPHLDGTEEIRLKKVYSPRANDRLKHVLPAEWTLKVDCIIQLNSYEFQSFNNSSILRLSVDKQKVNVKVKAAFCEGEFAIFCLSTESRMKFELLQL